MLILGSHIRPTGSLALAKSTKSTAAKTDIRVTTYAGPGAKPVMQMYVFDGDFRAYIRDFICVFGSVFDSLLGLVADPPPSPSAPWATPTRISREPSPSRRGL